MKGGTISGNKASDIRESLEVLNKILSAQISERALEKAGSMEQNYGIPAHDLVKNIYSNYREGSEKVITAKEGKYGRFVTKGGKEYEYNPVKGKYQIKRK